MGDENNETIDGHPAKGGHPNIVSDVSDGQTASFGNGIDGSDDSKKQNLPEKNTGVSIDFDNVVSVINDIFSLSLPRWIR